MVSLCSGYLIFDHHLVLLSSCWAGQSGCSVGEICLQLGMCHIFSLTVWAIPGCHQTPHAPGGMFKSLPHCIICSLCLAPDMNLNVLSLPMLFHS